VVHILLLHLTLLLLPVAAVDALVPQANVAVNGVIAVLEMRTVELDVKPVHVLAVVHNLHLLQLTLLLHLTLLLLPVAAVDALVPQANVAVNGVTAVLEMRTVELDVRVELVMQLVSHRALSQQRKAMPFHLCKLALL